MDREEFKNEDAVKQAVEEAKKQAEEAAQEEADQKEEAEAAEQGHEELIVLDRVGRLQLPKDYLGALGLKGGDKVRVELEEDKICIYRRE